MSTEENRPKEMSEDPRFIKVLVTSLLSEIATLELMLKETESEIRGFKETVAKGLEKRKVLKESIEELTKNETVLKAALETLERELKHRSIELETAKKCLDDTTLREIADRDKYKKILDDYHETWQKYKATYEERPGAKERQRASITLKHLRGRLMMAEYEKQHLITMLKQRKGIDRIRVKVSIVEISGMILQRWKEQNHVRYLNKVAEQLQDQLKAYISELSQLEQEEERKKRAEIEASVMPPPRLDFSFMQSICNRQDRFHKMRYPRCITSNRDPDAVSVNTLMLEEMCNTTLNDETTEFCKNNQAVEEVEEQSLDIPNSVSVIQESASNKADKTTDSEPIVNQSDLQSKLKKLRIEKKTTFAFDENEEERQAESNNINNYNNTENENENYERNVMESHRRTLRWCKESQNKFALYSLSGHRSNSFNDRTKGDLIDEGCKLLGQSFTKASSIHGSETKRLRQSERDKKFKNGASMEVADETRRAMNLKDLINDGRQIDEITMQKQRKHRSGEKLGENTPIETKMQKDISILGETSNNAKQFCETSQLKTITANNSQQIYESSQSKTPKLDENLVPQESRMTDDNLELPIDNDCSKPKIRKIETVSYHLGEGLKSKVITNESNQPDMSYSPKRYVPSCMSSLSNIYEASLLESSQVSFGGEGKTPMSGFPPLSNWKNWSPPNSETSLASSISKIENKQQNPSTEQDQTSQLDFGGFFTLQPTQITKNMF